MNFEDYLKSKKIDSAAFKNADSKLYASWQTEFEQMHEKSFSARKLNFINNIRRKYLLKEAEVEGSNKATIVAKPKPIIKPKIN